MRISTSMIFEMGTSNLNDLMSNISKTQEQISSGLKIQTPSDDPVAAAAALGVTQAISMNTQYGVNRQNANDSLGQEESNLSSAVSLLTSVQSTVVAAGNGALDDSQRQDYVTQLKSDLSQLLGIANAKDSQGNYIFAGYQTQSQPFTQTSTGATYSGDQGQRMLQVSPSRQMAISDSGATVFEDNPTGNGYFVTAAGTGNTGTGIISQGSVSDMSQLNGQTYTLTFSVDPSTGDTTYLVNPPPTTPATPQPFTSGDTITVGGAQFNITGAPADGDTFTVGPSTNQSVFTTLTNLINTLSTSGEGAVNQTVMTNGLNAASANITNALNNIAAVQASVGSRMNELDDLDSQGSDLNIQYTQTLSDLQDIDPVQAYSSLVQQQYTLQAAQQSFVSISNLSLFNYLNT